MLVDIEELIDLLYSAIPLALGEHAPGRQREPARARPKARSPYESAGAAPR